MDPEGNTFKNVEITSPIYYLTISEHFIFAGSSDEDNNPLILCIKRTGAEAEDLARLSTNFKNLVGFAHYY
jgi:hypothetical protein